jgi:Tfp pilus assembly protein PilZ
MANFGEDGVMVKPCDERVVASLPMVGGTLAAQFTDRKDLARQRREFIAASGLFLKTDQTAPMFSEFELTLILPDGSDCTPLKARVVQCVVGPEPGLMVQLLDDTAELANRIDEFLAKGEDAGNGDQAAELPAWKARKLDQKRIEKRMPFHEKMRAMLPNDRARLAARANRKERAFLMRDTEPVVLQFLLKNPHLTRGEVVDISKLTSLNYQIIRQIMANTAWAQNEEIRFNLVRNPKTPTSIALKLVPQLNMKHLRDLAKDHGVKAQIKQSALRLVVQRSS